MSVLAIGCLILVLFALIGIGLAFAGYALFAAFLPLIGAAWAAAVAAFIFLVLATIICLAASAQINARLASGKTIFKGLGSRGAAPQDATMGFLSSLTKDRPILGLVATVLIGAAGAFLNRRR
jgi:hypothetical protein